MNSIPVMNVILFSGTGCKLTFFFGNGTLPQLWSRLSGFAPNCWRDGKSLGRCHCNKDWMKRSWTDGSNLFRVGLTETAWSMDTPGLILFRSGQVFGNHTQLLHVLRWFFFQIPVWRHPHAGNKWLPFHKKQLLWLFMYQAPWILTNAPLTHQNCSKTTERRLLISMKSHGSYFSYFYVHSAVFQMALG